VCVHVCMCACVRVCACACVCMCACVCACVRVSSVPTVKMPRMLITSAYALQQLLKKTELTGLSSVQVGCCCCVTPTYESSSYVNWLQWHGTRHGHRGMGRGTIIKMTCGSVEHIICSLWHAIFHSYHSMVSV